MTDTDQILRAARAAYRAAPPVGDSAYELYCRELARGLTSAWPEVIRANERDVDAALRRGLPDTLVGRLRLTDRHLDYLVALTVEAAGALSAISEPEPGVRVGDWGVLYKVPKPLGVALMIYEARPTVSVEGALLPVAVGNAVLLRGGKEIGATNAALAEVIRAALVASGLPGDMVTLLADPDRSVLRALLSRADAVDVLIPRGSPSLIDYCRTNSTIPLIASGGGVNHLYVHNSADLDLAALATLDSKLPEPSACNTVELVLVDESVAEDFVARLLRHAERGGEPVTVKLDAALPMPAQGDGPWRVARMEPYDTGREFLDPTVAVLPVTGPRAAIEHIRTHGSAHTEGVIAGDRAVIEDFTRRVDAAAIVVNGSLRLHDGNTLELGAEVSISTGRLHVRGPVGMRSLLTYTWVVEANGTLRATADGSAHSNEQEHTEMSTVDDIDHASVAESVKRVVIAESRLPLRPSDVADDEPLNGDLLRVNSLGFLGMLVRLEDELSIQLPDDLFVGRSFATVADLVAVVLTASAVHR